MEEGFQIENAPRKAPLKVKPFIKWVGGKRSALEYLSKRVPDNYKTYYECFLGGGALFFKMQPKKAQLYDINKKLIIVYNVIKNDVQLVIRELKKHKKKSSKEYFLKCRDNFNKETDEVKIAAYFIYLNKTCFNGLYRVNKRGDFNVPYGKYKNPNIVDEENLLNISKLFENVIIGDQPFYKTKIEKGSFYYLDPPYHKTYDQYDENKFDIKDHISLGEYCSKLNKAGALFMVSNSDTKEIRKIYRKFNIEVIEVSKSVSCESRGRKKEKELIVRNYG